MSINTEIETALQPICSNIWPLKCPDESPPDEYMVYNPELEEAVLFADNEDLEWVHHMQVHLFIRGNYMKKRKEIRKALRKAEFIVTDITTLYEKDSRYHHLCFSCSKEESEE